MRASSQGQVGVGYFAKKNYAFISSFATVMQAVHGSDLLHSAKDGIFLPKISDSRNNILQQNVYCLDRANDMVNFIGKLFLAYFTKILLKTKKSARNYFTNNRNIKRTVLFFV
jgi:hypothetical protein